MPVKSNCRAVNWQEVGTQAKQAAKQVSEKIKTGIEEVSKGKVNFGLFGAEEPGRRDLGQHALHLPAAFFDHHPDRP